MVVRKFNYYRFFVFIFIIVSLIIGSIILVKRFNYKKTYDYKLSVVGYNEQEINIIKSKLDNNKIDEILNVDYDSDRTEFLEEKYFIYKNLNKYLEYKEEHKGRSNTEVVAIINTEANIDWIDLQKETDTTKGKLMLVNRIYGLSEEYKVDDVISVPASYAYNNVKISESIYDNIVELIESAKEYGYTLVLSDGYRSYEEQKKLYDNYKKSYGEREADLLVARPGHSEYETGISFNIVPYNKVYKNPKESEEYLWLKNNAYKYGFIFRYTKEKKELTGFDEFTWRLRYVGVDAATIINNENICFEEYYAYYIDKE